MRKIYLEILPLSFNAVDPGVVNEKNKTGNASHVIQCSSLHSRYRKGKRYTWKCFPCHSMQFTQFQV